jgi:DNA-binding transcriptional regulator LsrR (DeoR family)
MPREISQKTLDIIEMYRQGMRPAHIAEKLGTTQPIVNAAIKTGRRNGMLPTRKPTAMHRQTMLRKYGLRLGSMAEVHGGLTREQLVVLAGEAADTGADRLSEYVLEITRDYLSEQEAKKTND